MTHAQFVLGLYPRRPTVPGADARYRPRLVGGNWR